MNASVAIHRYWGDDPKNEPLKKEDHLRKLLKKVEERRKRKNTSNVRTVSDETSSIDEIEHKAKWQKKDTSSKDDVANTHNTEEPEKDVAENSADMAENEPQSEVPHEELEDVSFSIIKSQAFTKKQKVKRVLPSWLSNPSIIPTDLKNLTTPVDSIPGLDRRLVRTLKKNKITHFFPVQCQLIPWLLKCHEKSNKFWPQDVCVSAPTGSGKTLAFALPIIQILSKERTRRIRALVVLPTKDLATQVYRVFRLYTMGTRLKVTQLVASRSFEKEKATLVKKYEYGDYFSLVDIVVATPGRLIEHILYTQGFTLKWLKFMVIDEADHVMESTQNDWLYHVRKHLTTQGVNYSVPYATLSAVMSEPFRPQRLLFSATMSQDPEKLQTLELFQPKLFTSVITSNTEIQIEGKERGNFVGKYTTPKELTEYYAICELPVKPLILYHLIQINNWHHIMCFVNSVESVHKLAVLLRQLSLTNESKKPLRVKEISSKLSLKDHGKVISEFKKGNIDIVVTTDSLARGIDIMAVKCVVLYDCPLHPKTYIHRVGRTARAGQEGIAVTLVTTEQAEHYQDILNKTGKQNVTEISVQSSELEYLEAAYKSALENLRNRIKKELIRTKKNKHVSAHPARHQNKKKLKKMTNSNEKERKKSNEKKRSEKPRDS